MDFNELQKLISRGEDSRHQFKENLRNGDSLAAEMVAFSNSRGTGVRRALQDWPQIQFIDDRDGCLFTSLVERPVPSFSKKERLKGQDAPINASLSGLQIQILKIIENDPWAAYEDIAVTLEKDRSTIRRNIQQLKSLGILQRSGSKKKGHG